MRSSLPDEVKVAELCPSGALQAMHRLADAETHLSAISIENMSVTTLKMNLVMAPICYGRHIKDGYVCGSLTALLCHKLLSHDAHVPVQRVNDLASNLTAMSLHDVFFRQVESPRFLTVKNLISLAAAFEKSEFSAHFEQGKCWKSQKDFAELLGVSLSTVKDAYRQHRKNWSTQKDA